MVFPQCTRLPSAEGCTARLAGAVDALVDELNSHAQHEDRFIHPLLRTKVPALAASLDAAHIELEDRLEHLRKTARNQGMGSGDPDALYRTLASFTASYLEHLAVEEDRALPSLWEHCSDQELFAIMTSFKASRSPSENLTSLIAQLPTLSPSEIAHLVSVGVEPTDLSVLAELLATTLDPVQLGALRAPVLSHVPGGTREVPIGAKRA